VDLRLPEGVPEVGVSLPLAGDETLHRADIDGGLMLETADARGVRATAGRDRLRIIAIIR
jgi:hypothetical protein